MSKADEVVDEKARAYPGDPKRGEIALLKPGEFDEDGPPVQLLQDEVQFPSGKRQKMGRVTRSPRADDGVVIAPITETDEIVLLRQFRHAPRVWLWEMPRGGTEPGRTPTSTLYEELLQEIGFQPCDVPFSLGRLVPDSGSLHEIPYLFAVRVRPHPTKSASPEPTECISGHTTIDYETLFERCVSGAINDGFTVAATMRLRPHFSGGRFAIDQRYIHMYSAFEYRTPGVASQP